MDFVHGAGLFTQQLDIGGDRVLLVRMTEHDYRDASFLDDRLLQQQRPMQWVDWSQLAQVDGQLPDNAQFIFHIGHVGSTLISRLLGEAQDTLSLREPQILRQLTEMKAIDGQPHSPWAPNELGERLPSVLRWLSRTFDSGHRSLVKATSFVSEIANDILGKDRKAVFLTLRPERYIQTILAGENSRHELGVLSSGRMERLHRRLGAQPLRLWELDEAKRAAMGWATEMTALHQASSHNTLWVDFDDFLTDPSGSLSKISSFLTINLSTSQIEQLVAGPIMQQYSKAPEHGYNAQLREEVLAGAARDRRDDIAAAMVWLEDLAREHSRIASTMSRSPGDK